MSEPLVKHLNGLDADAAIAELQKCCGSSWWCGQLAARRPFDDAKSLLETVDEVFDRMPREAWLEAFAAHPRIGDLDSLRMKFAGNREWSGGEQAGVSVASDEVLQALAQGNDDYFECFGYLFIVCATGKSADEMLAILKVRLGNDAESELAIAAGEQRKITRLRLEKLAASLAENETNR
ncbi:2-oxo-4-hydroxy-4-carboxy-5-ureidoimidazoline decarboxylase [Aeoliella sp. SH292]|uniref:2-oxo-4-hydroxy-4-carboxy-5-ureidoimidazoline decarboxylase n=1 Tax=Aeoliella sp. SH292 TaxID=3454464 RepID=UPI003F9BA314